MKELRANIGSLGINELLLLIWIVTKVHAFDKVTRTAAAYTGSAFHVTDRVPFHGLDFPRRAKLCESATLSACVRMHVIVYLTLLSAVDR